MSQYLEKKSTEKFPELQLQVVFTDETKQTHHQDVWGFAAGQGLTALVPEEDSHGNNSSCFKFGLSHVEWLWDVHLGQSFHLRMSHFSSHSLLHAGYRSCSTAENNACSTTSPPSDAAQWLSSDFHVLQISVIAMTCYCRLLFLFIAAYSDRST